MIATVFRYNNGKVKGIIGDVMKDLCSLSLVQLEQSINGETSSLDDGSNVLKEHYTSVELPVLRKLFAIVYVLRAAAIGKDDHDLRKANQEKFQ